MENQCKIPTSLNGNPMEETVRESIADHDTIPQIREIYFSPAEIWRKIRKLPKGKAPGPDEISNSALKHSGKKVILQLTHIYNGWARLEYFPLPWKQETIIMIPKPGKDIKQPTSHRPISLLNSMAKVLEFA